MHEPFRQWAIEDKFVAGRPGWHRVGAQLVGDVAPFEAMKLRLLNGSHSALAYLGFLAGHEYIYEVAAQPAFAEFMRRLMADEVEPSLSVPRGVDIAAYEASLLARFGNPALPHRTQQIAMDGSQKLPQRLLGTVRDNLAAGRPINLLALAVAGWMRYVSGADEAGREIKVSDPLAPELARILAAHRGRGQGPASLHAGRARAARHSRRVWRRPSDGRSLRNPSCELAGQAFQRRLGTHGCVRHTLRLTLRKNARRFSPSSFSTFPRAARGKFLVQMVVSRSRKLL